MIGVRTTDPNLLRTSTSRIKETSNTKRADAEIHVSLNCQDWQWAWLRGILIFTQSLNLKREWALHASLHSTKQTCWEKRLSYNYSNSIASRFDMRVFSSKPILYQVLLTDDSLLKCSKRSADRLQVTFNAFCFSLNWIFAVVGTH